MNRFLYNLGITVLAPFLMAWMGLRARRAGGQWGVLSPTRFGRYKGASVPGRPVWVHAVSLGETRAAQPLIRALLAQGDKVLLTHMTATGRAEAAREYREAITNGRLIQEWLPYDFSWSVKRFLNHYQPQLGVMIEREIWPNIIAAAYKRGIPMMLVSARFSDNALRQSLRLGRLMRNAYEELSAVYAQTLHDAQRLEQAGASAVRVSGNFKFDVTMPAEQVQRGREFASALSRKIVCIASTREGEDELFIAAIAQQIKRSRAQGDDMGEQPLFCIIPRHPQRFDYVATMISRAGLSCVRRSTLNGSCGTSASAVEACRHVDILLGDSLGEMPRYYAASHVAIVAGSFLPFGGQNLIEACAIGTPVIVGPHTRNFEQAAAGAVLEGAALRTTTPEAAILAAMQLLHDPQRTSKMGEAGAFWVKQHAGAVERVLIGLNGLKQNLPVSATHD